MAFPLPTDNPLAHRQHYRPLAALFTVAAVAIIILLSGCGKAGQDTGGMQGGMPAMPVTVIEAKQDNVPIIIEAVGQTEGSKDVEVRARVSGILTRQRYTEGDKVRKGTTLFTIDREPYEIALAQARAALEQDQANLQKAQREATRLKPLVEEKAVSQLELDDANTLLISANAAVMASKARLREAELNLSYTRVSAPITGITGRAQFSEGTLVTPGTATSLLTTMHSIDPIWVRFGLSESESARLRKAGGKTEVKLLLADDSTYASAGKLNFTASTIDANTGMVQMRAAFPNPDSTLLPGQFVRVQVTIGTRKAYRIPQAAVFQSDQGKLVFTVTPDNTVAPRPVETEGWLGHDWVVIKGLSSGDRIITDNLMKLRPGAAVKPHAAGEVPDGTQAETGKPAKS